MTAKRRTLVYVGRPATYQIAGCPCGNDDPDWSEFAGMLWCAKCKKDFTPEDGGIFDGPIPVNAAHLLGIDLRRFNLRTQKIIGPEGETSVLPSLKNKPVVLRRQIWSAMAHPKTPQRRQQKEPVK